MSGPPVGPCAIQLAVGPQQVIGANAGVLQPVVVGGQEKTWLITKLDDGNYTIILDESKRSTQPDDGEVVVTADKRPPASWTIYEQENGSYTITIPSCISPTRGWTLNSPDVEFPVTLNYVEVVLPNQLWNITPVLK